MLKGERGGGADRNNSRIIIKEPMISKQDVESEGGGWVHPAAGLTKNPRTKNFKILNHLLL